MTMKKGKAKNRTAIEQEELGDQLRIPVDKWKQSPINPFQQSFHSNNILGCKLKFPIRQT
jgi:hypothetical protein